MNEIITFPLERIIKTNDKILTMVCVPLVSSAKDLAMIFKKRLNNYFPEVFYVSWDKEDNSSYISYEQLEEYTNRYNSCLFITNNVNDFYPYMDNLVKNNNNGNFFFNL